MNNSSLPTLNSSCFLHCLSLTSGYRMHAACRRTKKKTKPTEHMIMHIFHSEHERNSYITRTQRALQAQYVVRNVKTHKHALHIAFLIIWTENEAWKCIRCEFYCTETLLGSRPLSEWSSLILDHQSSCSVCFVGWPLYVSGAALGSLFCQNSSITSRNLS